MKAMFLDIRHMVATRNQYFQRRVNAAGVARFTTLQKVTVTVHMLAYEGHADRLDEYIRMGQSTIIECVNKFTRMMVKSTWTYILENRMQRILLGSLKLQSSDGFRGCLVV
jgi:hypothetical protein